MAARPFLVGSGLALASLALVLACGSSGDDSQFGSSGGTSGDGTSGTSGSSGFGSSGLGEGGTSGTSGASGDGGNCNAPVDMYIMFDRSGSMGADCNIGGTAPSKWCRSVNALSGYLNSAGAAGQAAALQFFPLTTHTKALCTTGTGYDTPAEPTAAAEYTTLPTNAFDALLNSTAPDGTGGANLGTPTEAAIRGMNTYTAAHRRPGNVTIGVLITDGDPNGCDQSLTNLSNLLDAHFKATTLRTYVIGMQGATFANLEQIAAGGNAPDHPNVVGTLTNACGNGKATCKTWNVGDGNPQAFIAALAAIQDSANGCKPGGGTINPPR